MEPRHLIRAAIVVSVVGHLALAAGVFFADARPIETAAPDNVAVDLVTPQQLAEAEKKAGETPPKPEKKPEPDKPEFRLPDLTIKPTLEEQKTSAASVAKPPSQTQGARQQSQPPPSAAQQAQQQRAAAAQSPPPSPAVQLPAQQQAALQPLQPAPPPADSAPSAGQAQPSGEAPSADQLPPQPDPDITVKYGVMLGLPGFGGGAATEQADIPKSDIAVFRNHLKSCLKRPANIALNDDAMVKLRATLSRDGRLTAEPSVIEVRRPIKAQFLVQAAKQALEACQPYSMLPADKYDEWKVLDLPFTPQDFAG